MGFHLKGGFASSYMQPGFLFASGKEEWPLAIPLPVGQGPCLQGPYWPLDHAPGLCPGGMPRCLQHLGRAQGSYPGFYPGVINLGFAQVKRPPGHLPGQGPGNWARRPNYLGKAQIRGPRPLIEARGLYYWPEASNRWLCHLKVAQATFRPASQAKGLRRPPIGFETQ